MEGLFSSVNWTKLNSEEGGKWEKAFMHQFINVFVLNGNLLEDILPLDKKELKNRKTEKNVFIIVANII